MKTSKPSNNIARPVAVPTRQVRHISTNKVPLRKTDSVLSIQPVKACSAAPSQPYEKSTVIVVTKPPLSVADVDKPDTGKIFLIPEYANEIYAYLRQLEVIFMLNDL